ncbi:polysaccharide lyase family 8 protein [Mycena olivaceomarginata]|nr:polysaccharide lyase family 8 protein [Mycena olivaceomarginata]
MKTSTVLSFIFYLSSLSATHATREHGPIAQRLRAVASASTTTTPTSTPTNSLSTDSVSASASASANTTATVASSSSAAPTVSTTTTSTPVTSSTAIPAAVLERRLSNIVGALTNASSIPSWLATLNATGQWPDVDYTSGCAGQRANWPAELHWTRITTLAGAWHGGLAGAEQYVKDPSLRTSISLAMGYWFSNDFQNPACLDSGGTDTCPCGTPGLWNTNWFPNIIGTPEVVSITCLLLDDTLEPSEFSNCTHITGRAYNTFIVPAKQVGVLTGANALDVAKIGIDLGLLTSNASLLTDAFARVHSQMVITTANRADGIRPDGSFGQHSGIIYNGNYGKDFTNDIVDLEVEAGGTQFQVSPAGQTAFATLFDGDAWMIYANTLTGVLHWDFVSLNGWCSTGSILLNLTKIGVLGEEWGSDTLKNFSTSLSQNATTANAGELARKPDVHRGASYVTTLKMLSTRSQNTECTNLANPFGFHLSDGALRTYLRGNEYEDIAAAMDWNLIPGITTDYGATANFVGGVSNGQLGVAAMRYTNPLTKNLHYQKSWFFLNDDVQVVLVSNISSATNASVISVLDQKLNSGPVVVDSKTTATPFAQHGLRSRSLWHGNVGYTFPNTADFSLSVEVGDKTGNWSAIGTSTQPPNTVDLFSAWLVHESLNASLAYTIFPDTDFDTFVKKVVQNDALVSAVLDAGSSKALAGSFNFAKGSPTAFTISTNGTAAVLFDWKSRLVTVSDPTQTLSALSVTLSVGGNPGSLGKTLNFTLPSASLGLAGSSVSQPV